MIFIRSNTRITDAFSYRNFNIVYTCLDVYSSYRLAFYIGVFQASDMRRGHWHLHKGGCV